MCGITGIIHLDKKPVSRAMLGRMTKILEHRGPDGSGFLVQGHVGFGHRRLAIIDVKGGAQPMYDRTKRYAIIFNGEIYNYEELRDSLVKSGSTFKTNSDTEVILEGFAKHGVHFFEKLNGMFAFAILDVKTSEVTLCRDRLGIKPLYLYTSQDNKTILFASEIKGFYGHDAFVPEPNDNAIKEYLTFSNIHHNISFFKRVTQLEPGSWLRITSGAPLEILTSTPYWKSSYNHVAATHEEHVLKFRMLAEASIKRHMISEVPLGSYLSGGIDSSGVAVTAAKIRAAASSSTKNKKSAQSQPMHVFTGVFPEQGKYTELPCAQATAKAIGAEHHIVTITPEDFKASIEKIVYALDEPRVGMGAFPQYHVSKLVSEHVTVVLTGHGGDELFAGYPLYKARVIKSLLSNPRAALRALVSTKPSELPHILYYLFYPLAQPEVGYGTFIMFSRAQQRHLLTKEFQKRTATHDPFGYVRALAARKDLRPEDRVQEIYMRTYLPSLFIVEDKVGMAHSIEARTPICDNTLVEYSTSIPLSQKLHKGVLKSIPKDAFKDRLPSELYAQPKKGFPTPLSLWFRGPLRDEVHAVLLSDSFAKRGICEIDAIRALIERHERSRSDGLHDYVQAARMWALINVELWFRIFIDGAEDVRARGRA